MDNCYRGVPLGGLGYPVGLFNELYYLNAGGTTWTDGHPPKKAGFAPSGTGGEPFCLLHAADGVVANGTTGAVVDDIASAMASATERSHAAAAFGTALLCGGEENVGQFMYLEGMEYSMYNTYDVHFYFGSRCRRPLTRKTSDSQGILSPYRLLIAIRLVALRFFLTWHIRHPNPEAVWLWAPSVTCEVWFAFFWLLDSLPKLCPVHRAADLDVLAERFELPTARNPKGRSDLPGIDVFVSTVDPEKEPPLVTAKSSAWETSR